MKQSTTLVLALGIAMSAAAGLAIAAQPASPSGRARLDANGDGVITRAEAAAHPRLAERFDRIDRNRDGRIDASERPWRRGGTHARGGMRGGHAAGLLKLDVNADGRISRLEAKGSPLEQRFDSIDTNRDGHIVRSEFEAARERMRAERMKQREAKANERFAAADTNRDGRLSRDEVARAMPKLADAFAWLDDNRDGFLTREELRFGRGHGRR